MCAPIIRKEPKASNGRNNGDLDVAFQLFSIGMVWDGNLASKESRDYLVAQGFACRKEGMNALTGRGALAFLASPAVWVSAFRRWRLWRRNPFVAIDATIKRALR